MLQALTCLRKQLGYVLQIVTATADKSVNVDSRLLNICSFYAVASLSIDCCASASVFRHFYILACVENSQEGTSDAN